MSHAAALTEQAISLWDGGHTAKGIARLLACSHRTIEDWKARRRAMCLDHAIELAAKNDQFHAALELRIEQTRKNNESAQRFTTTAVGGQGASGGGVVQSAGESVWGQGSGLVAGEQRGQVAGTGEGDLA